MIRNRFSRRTIKSYEDIHYSCTIRFLDDSEPISVVFQKDTLGQWLIDHVCQELNLLEKDYFGLRFVDNDKQRHWLDPLKPVYRQLKNVEPMVLCFRVKFYPSDPMKLKEELTRYFLFLQLRRDLHHGRLLCSPADANLLAAYVIQSEVGDYDPQDHPEGYISEFKILPKQTQKQEEKIGEVHKTLTGQVPADSEGNFLKKANSLETYGVDPHPVKDQKGNSMYLGVTHLGIVTFQGNKRTHLFKWSQISKIAFEGKMFIVHVAVADKKHACGFKCPTVAACKHLWKCAIEQQYFFTLNAASEAPKVTSSGSLFSRRSKFRFSGRCQREVYTESAHISRDEPNFVRSPSNPNFSRSNSNLKTNSLPSHMRERTLGEVIVESIKEGADGDGNTGNDITVLEETLPEETPVPIGGETPYKPLDSPSQENLPPVPDLVQTQEEHDAKMKEQESEQREAYKENAVDIGDTAVTQPAEEAADVTMEILAPEKAPQVETSPEPAKTEAEPVKIAAAVTAETTDPKKSSSVLAVILSILFVILFSFVILVVLMEVNLDIPVLRDIQRFPEFRNFKHTYYSPVKNSFSKKFGY